MLRSAIWMGVVLSLGSVAQAGTVVELVPDAPPPYFGAVSVTVDDWLNTEVSLPSLLKYGKVAFLDRDPGRTLDAAFAFDFDTAPGRGYGYPSFSHPDLPFSTASQGPDCNCPSGPFELRSDGPLLIGSIGVELPVVSGLYRLDMLNAAGPGTFLGTRISTQPQPQDAPPPGHYWRALNGDLARGTCDFVVLPEPVTGVLMLGGALGTLSALRRWHRRPVLRSAVWIGMFGCVGAIVQAGEIVELVPDRPAPYFGGESMTVDVWSDDEISWPVPFSVIQFAFLDSDLALGLDSALALNFDAAPSGGYRRSFFSRTERSAHRASQGLNCGRLTCYSVPPDNGSLRIGAIGLGLPVGPGMFRIEMLDADEQGAFFGMQVQTFPSSPDPPVPGFDWRAFRADITGRTHNFVVIPEPTTGALVLAGSLGIIRTLQRRRTPRNLGPTLVPAAVLASADTASGQPMAVPARKVEVAVDFEFPSAQGSRGDASAVFYETCRLLALHKSAGCKVIIRRSNAA